MIRSMTGFASAQNAQPPFSWSWELRSVNGKGQDLRIRTPDWIDGLEAGLRKTLGAATVRGNITCNLRLSREDGGSTLAVSAPQLALVLAALQEIEAQAMDAGVSLAPSKATDIVTIRGVLEQTQTQDDGAALAKVLLADFDSVLRDFNDMRASEGSALAQVLEGQLAQIDTLTAQADALAQERAADMAAALQRNLAKVVDNVEGIAPDRIAAELAMIAVKADITEELDRLRAHTTAAIF